MPVTRIKITVFVLQGLVTGFAGVILRPISLPDAISEPVKPIQYWVDSGAPDDVKKALLEGASWWNQAFEAAGLEGAVVAIIGDSPTVGANWATPVGFLFIDGGHAEDVAMADYDMWAHRVLPGGVLAIHDCFEDPADGGQAPFHVWERAVRGGFEPVSTTGSLRVLRKA